MSEKKAQSGERVQGSRIPEEAPGARGVDSGELGTRPGRETGGSGAAGCGGSRCPVSLAASNVKTVDREAALERLGGDAELLLETIQSFLEVAAELLGEIREAIASGDPKKTALLAHSVKGIAATLEARKLVAEARRLEVLGSEGDLVGARAAMAGFESELGAVLAALREELPA